jgi:hypothetical protein
MTRQLAAFAASLLLAGGAAAQSEDSTLAAQSARMDTLAGSRGEGEVALRISADFSAFAGSPENASALVTGLRSGTEISLASGGEGGATTFTPPTGRMGYGNVYAALALAKQQLAGYGITQPAAEDLRAALTGGTITTVNGRTATLSGVLQMRADGMGWGQIARVLGFKLGPVVSAMRSANARIGAPGASTAAGGTTTNAAATANVSSGKRVVNAAGDAQGRGHAYGRGIVSAGGGAGRAGAESGSAHGRGIVNAGGGAPGGQAAAGQGSRGKALAKGQP